MITDEQYQAVKPIYEALYAKGKGAVNVEDFIAQIEGSPGVRALFFDADHDTIYRRYQLERAREFIQLWAERQARQIVGVAMRPPRLPKGQVDTEREGTVYRPLEHAYQDEATAEAAQRFYRHGLAEVRKHAPYCEAWGQSIADVIGELKSVIGEIEHAVQDKRVAA